MARPEKVAVVDEVREELTGATAVLFTEYRGLTVSELAELRTQLRDAGARYKVVKNTLALLAAREAGFEDVEEVLTGPTALAFTGDDPVSPAKVLRQFAKDHPELVVKGAILEGRMVDAQTAGRLADLETREELLGRMAGLMNGALANFARLLQAPIAHVARLVAALEAEGGAPGAPSADEEAAPAADEEAAPAGTEPEGTEVAAQATSPSGTDVTEGETEGEVAEAADTGVETTAPAEDVPADQAEEPVPADEGGTAEAASEPTDAESTGTEAVDADASATGDEAAPQTADETTAEASDEAEDETTENPE